MGGSSYEDFLLRQLRQFARFLAQALGLASAGRLDEAEELLQQGETELLGDKGRLVRLLDTASGAALLDNPRLIFAMAQLCAAEAGVARRRDQPAAARPLEQRALEYALEAWKREPDMEEVGDFIRAASAGVDVAGLDASHREALKTFQEGGAGGGSPGIS